MHISNTAFLLAAASTVMAGSVHMRHAEYHNKRAVGDIVVVTMDGKVVSWTNTYAGPTALPAAPAAAPSPAAPAANPAAPSPAAAPAAAPAVASAVANAANVVTSFKQFCSRSTNEEIAAAGNLGTANGCSYASNLMLVADDLESKYQYTAKIVNNLGSTVTCGAGNKIGKDNGIDGFFGQPPVQFTLGNGQSQVVAIDQASIGFITCAEGDSIPLNSFGQIMGTEMEFEMGSEYNGNWSGMDLSIIGPTSSTPQGPFIAAKLTVPGVDKYSAVDANGVVDNAYYKGNAGVDGLGVNVGPTDNLSAVVTLGA